MKIELTAERETLLVPLYSKAAGRNADTPILHDPKAAEILEALDYDFARLKVPPGTAVTLCIRAKKLDAYVTEFAARHPEGLVLHLACGLDDRHGRVGCDELTWYDLDLPEVIELRRHFFAESPRHHMIASSVTSWEWLDGVAWSGQPTLVVAEGLLMYLSANDVRTLLLKLRERYPGCELAFDTYSELTARKAQNHPSLQKTGAKIQWGVDDAAALETWAPGIELLEEWSFTQSQDIGRWGAGFWLMFKLAGLFAIARRAHRIVRFRLGTETGGSSLRP